MPTCGPRTCSLDKTALALCTGGAQLAGPGRPENLATETASFGRPFSKVPEARIIRSNRARGLTSQHFTGAPSFASRLMDQHYSSDVCADHFSLESAALIDVWFDAERFAACADEECGLNRRRMLISHQSAQLQKTLSSASELSSAHTS